MTPTASTQLSRSVSETDVVASGQSMVGGFWSFTHTGGSAASVSSHLIPTIRGTAQSFLTGSEEQELSGHTLVPGHTLCL